MFDYIPFPVFTHTTGMAHFQLIRVNNSFAAATDFSNWHFVLSEDGTLVSKHVRDALLIFVLIETVCLVGVTNGVF